MFEVQVVKIWFGTEAADPEDQFLAIAYLWPLWPSLIRFNFVPEHPSSSAAHLMHGGAAALHYKLRIRKFPTLKPPESEFLILGEMPPFWL
ncbi:hypothetical protein [Pseudomonas paraeruginosa]|uniref:hypothetical protein n=1 Tax=Pseudomonas paraeruginosa TaxID=2994495 RepID=UPI0039FD6FE1